MDVGGAGSLAVGERLDDADRFTWQAMARSSRGLLTQPDAGAFAVLVDEDHACLFERSANCGEVVFA